MLWFSRFHSLLKSLRRINGQELDHRIRRIERKNFEQEITEETEKDKSYSLFPPLPPVQYVLFFPRALCTSVVKFVFEIISPRPFHVSPPHPARARTSTAVYRRLPAP